MIRIKICGITNLNDALAAINYGADALGFVFYTKSPRYITPETAKNIIEQLPPFVQAVGLFVNHSAEQVKEVIKQTGIHLAQYHGDESPDLCQSVGFPYIRAVRVQSFDDVIEAEQQYCQAKALLLDSYHRQAYGGTGCAFDWSVVNQQCLTKPIIIAGGLHPGNVQAMINMVQPYAVDVSSGVEQSKGIKDHSLLDLFCRRIK